MKRKKKRVETLVGKDWYVQRTEGANGKKGSLERKRQKSLAFSGGPLARNTERTRQKTA